MLTRSKACYEATTLTSSDSCAVLNTYTHKNDPETPCCKILQYMGNSLNHCVQIHISHLL